MSNDEVAIEDTHVSKTASSSGNTIVSSAYFQPKIIDTYLQSSLNSIDFPKESIQALRVLLKDLDDVGFDLREKKAREAFDQILKGISTAQREALRESIKALSAQIVILSQKSDKSRVDVIVHREEVWRRRCLLGYCKILDQQWPEAIIELDLVRRDVYRYIVKGAKADENVRTRRSIYIDSLHGLELASLLVGKGVDAVRYAKWRKAVT